MIGQRTGQPLPRALVRRPERADAIDRAVAQPRVHFEDGRPQRLDPPQRFGGHLPIEHPLDLSARGGRILHMRREPSPARRREAELRGERTGRALFDLVGEFLVAARAPCREMPVAPAERIVSVRAQRLYGRCAFDAARPARMDGALPSSAAPAEQRHEQRQ